MNASFITSVGVGDDEGALADVDLGGAWLVRVELQQVAGLRRAEWAG
jgi:hypothetical protein